jgi:hypothetical protein
VLSGWSHATKTSSWPKEPPITFRIILNGALFYAAWFGACTFAAQGSALFATLVPLTVVAIHVALETDRGTALRLIGVAAVIGFVGDSIAMTIARSSFSAPGPLPMLAPPWVVALWMAFATLPNHAMRFFRDRLALTAVLALVFGPLTYWFGAQMGAGKMGEPLWLGLALLAVLWAVAAPLLLALAQRWEAPPSPAP